MVPLGAADREPAKPGKRAPVVSDPQRDLARLRYLCHPQAFRMIERHRLLDEARLSRRRNRQCQLAVRCRKRHST